MLFVFVVLFCFFTFLFSTNTDRQTDKPKSRFQEATEAQAKLLSCYTDIFSPNDSHEIKNVKSVMKKNVEV
jgi:F0F1-type ATP synthase membrane subunit a